MLPLSVIRFRFELIPALAGCTKQKLPTTSTIQKSLSPVAASMIFSVGGNSISVVYLSLAWIGTMSAEWYSTVRADASWARTAEAESATVITIAARAGERYVMGEPPYWFGELETVSARGSNG